MTVLYIISTESTKIYTMYIHAYNLYAHTYIYIYIYVCVCVHDQMRLNYTEKIFEFYIYLNRRDIKLSLVK